MAPRLSSRRDAVLREIEATLADEARRKAALEAADAPAVREEPTPPWLRG